MSIAAVADDGDCTAEIVPLSGKTWRRSNERRVDVAGLEAGGCGGRGLEAGGVYTAASGGGCRGLHSRAHQLQLQAPAVGISALALSSPWHRTHHHRPTLHRYLHRRRILLLSA